MVSSLLAVGANAQPNLLTAGDFEGITSLTTYSPAAPGVWGTESSVLSGAANGVTPFGSQMLQLNHAGGGNASQTNQIVQGPFPAGSVVTFTAKINTWLTGQNVRLDIQTNAGLALNGTRYSSPTVALDTDTFSWQTVTATTTLTSDTNYISAEILLFQNSNGALFGQPRAYLDDAVLTVVPPLPTQTLTILGGSGNPGEIAANVEYYNPATGNWQPAYLADYAPYGHPVTHPWGNVSGTTRWINYKADGASDPGAGPTTANTLWYLYRVRFTVPADALEPKMTFSIKADNFAQVDINGVSAGALIEGQANGINADAVFSQNVNVGENTITIDVGDYGGLNGFNFRIDLSVRSAEPLEIVPIDTDTTPPVIAVPADITAEATSAAGAAVTFSASATDDTDGAVPVVADPASGSTFSLGSTVVDLGATDAAGNRAFATFNVTVQDTTAPALTVPADATAEATGPDGATVTYPDATATDAVGVASLTYSAASGSTFALGTTPVTVSAKDAAANTSNGSFNVTVQDTTPPALTLPADITAEATGPGGAAVTYPAATASDAVGVTSLSYSAASGSTFVIGTTAVAVSASDAAGNTSNGSFGVIVQDTTAPALTVPADVTAEATGPDGAAVTYPAATATDIVGVASLTYSTASGSTFALGSTSVAVNASDAAGNTSSGSFAVAVRDTTAPVISSLTASPAVLWPPNHKLVPVTLTAVTSDLVGVVATRIVSVTSMELPKPRKSGKDDDDDDDDNDRQLARNNPDWEITGNLTLKLRAERSGNGGGRVYTITVESRDAAGNLSAKTVTVTVPKSQGGGGDDDRGEKDKGKGKGRNDDDDDEMKKKKGKGK